MNECKRRKVVGCKPQQNIKQWNTSKDITTNRRPNPKKINQWSISGADPSLNHCWSKDENNNINIMSKIIN